MEELTEWTAVVVVSPLGLEWDWVWHWEGSIKWRNDVHLVRAVSLPSAESKGELSNLQFWHRFAIVVVVLELIVNKSVYRPILILSSMREGGWGVRIDQKKNHLHC